METPFSSQARQRRFDSYIETLAKSAGHADRGVPLRNYCTGLLIPGERKSVEPMAARLAPDDVRRMHQSLHHLVADAAWSDREMLRQVRNYALSAIQRKSPVVSWGVDDTGFLKTGSHSVGVTRQFCRQTGKQENCRVAVSLSIATWTSSLPIAWRLYLPEIWADDPGRRQRAGIADDIHFETKPQIALGQIREAVEEGVTPGVLVADAAYGSDARFREGITELNLEYVLRVQSSASVWATGKEPVSGEVSKRTRSRPAGRRRQGQQSVPVKQLALALPPEAWKNVNWRRGTTHQVRSRYAALRVRPAYDHGALAKQNPEEWLLIEWPKTEDEPTKYWLSTLSDTATLKDLVSLARQRWIVEQSHEELMQNLGLGHYEGRGWRGFHHHATLCTAAFGFLVAERSRVTSSAELDKLQRSALELPRGFRPRGAGPT